MEYPGTVAELTQRLRDGGYLADRGLATSLLVSLSLRRPLLLEGEVGVGKTEIAKVLAAVFGRRLIRLQCYEGISTSQALYEWDYARQMLQIRALSQAEATDDQSVDKLFGPKFLLERPLLEAVRQGDRAVLLIDEVDRADDEFEAFLLEVLSDFQISIPEIGTIKADSSPVVILTSNRTRELHDALRRRCLYHWIGYPTAEREAEIVAVREPDAAVDKLFGPKFLLERPLLEAIKQGENAVLLIDEVDRADDEFEAFLLEVLSDFQISIPEIGTIRADSPPIVILTSNRTRELHDALRRRCLYHWIGYPSAEREAEIVGVREPDAERRLTGKVVGAVHRMRELDLAKPPGVAETIDWVRTLGVLGASDLTPEAADDSLGAVVKDRDDLDLVRENLAEIISGA